MVRRVVVSAPAHLHAGNIDLHGGLGRLYGTVGFTITYPRLVLEAEKCSGIIVEPEDSPLAAYARAYAERLVVAYSLPGACIRLVSEIPLMVGLGSRTPLALGIASALSTLYRATIPLEDAALLTGRGIYTGLGFYSYTRGGMIVDAGFPRREKGRRIPVLVYRKALPENWRFLVVYPEKLRERVLDKKLAEDRILESMPAMEEGEAAKYSRIVLMKLLPAAEEENLGELLEALYALNHGLGKYWAHSQGSVYCCREVEEGIEILKEKGYPAAQSSWGPVFYTIAPGPGEAKRLAESLKEWLERVGGGKVWITGPDNRGAVVVEE